MNVRFLFFYADWCPYCKSYRPEWDTFKNAIDGKIIEGNLIQCIEYDCTDPCENIESIMQKYDVTVYPTVKLVSNYPDKRDTMALLQPIMNYKNSQTQN